MQKQPFAIDVYGAAAAHERAQVLERVIMDPLDSFKRRSLVPNVYSHNSTGRLHNKRIRKKSGTSGADFSAEPLTMIWPMHELSHGDFVRDTIIPLGFLYASGSLPRRIAFSGVGFPQSTEALANVAQLCVFERASTDPRILPRCVSNCYEAMHLCEVGAVAGRDAHRAVVALDGAMGAAFPVPLNASWLLSRRTLRVTFAVRRARRFVTNLVEVVTSCNGAVTEGFTMHCRAVEFGTLSLATVIRTMRATDVFVTMHGGDVIHAAHMRPGARVIELVNEGFHLANWRWLHQYKLVLRPTFKFHQLTMPSSTAINYSGVNMSEIHSARMRAAPLEVQEKRLHDIVYRAWNANSTLRWSALQRELGTIVNETIRLDRKLRATASYHRALARRTAAIEARKVAATAAAARKRVQAAKQVAAVGLKNVGGEEAGAAASRTGRRLRHASAKAADKDHHNLGRHTDGHVATLVDEVSPRSTTSSSEAASRRQPALVILLAYFGAWPEWFPLTLQTMGGVNEKRVDFCVIGDAAPPAAGAPPK